MSEEIEVSVMDYCEVKNEPIVTVDTKTGKTVNCIPYSDNTSVAMFENLICRAAHIEDCTGSKIKANWSQLIEENIDLFESYSDMYWSSLTTYESKDALVSDWIKELDHMFSGFMPESVYQTAYEHFQNITPVKVPAIIPEKEKSVFESKHVSSRKRLFIDMDGTLAEFRTIDTLETLYEKGYFKSLAPNDNVVAAIKFFKVLYPETEIFVLSAYLTDSKYALEEKNAWLDKYLPQVDKAHRIFTPCGEAKSNFIKNGLSDKDFLLDDYSLNLHDWEPPAKGIKLLNGINANNGTWKKNAVSFERDPANLAATINSIIQGSEVKDIPPQKSRISKGKELY